MERFSSIIMNHLVPWITFIIVMGFVFTMVITAIANFSTILDIPSAIIGMLLSTWAGRVSNRWVPAWRAKTIY